VSVSCTCLFGPSRGYRYSVAIPCLCKVRLQKVPLPKVPNPVALWCICGAPSFHWMSTVSISCNYVKVCVVNRHCDNFSELSLSLSLSFSSESYFIDIPHFLWLGCLLPSDKALPNKMQRFYPMRRNTKSEIAPNLTEGWCQAHYISVKPTVQWDVT
jgi:hypothetical protein